MGKNARAPYDTGTKRRSAGASGSAVAKRSSRALKDGFKSGRIFSFFGLMGLVALMYQLFTAPGYRVEAVELNGSIGLTAAEMEQITGVVGRNVFFVNTAKAAEIIRPLPYVRSVQVMDRWPNRVVVKIDERVPSVIWQVGETRYLVDDDGVVVGEASSSGDLITVRSASGVAQNPGDRVDPKALDTAQKLFLRVPRELGLPVTGLEYSPLTGITVLVNDGKSICFGDSDKLDDKFAIFRSFVGGGSNAAKWKYLDLRSVTKPYYR
ncbi:MAG: FtsQ-type POTRA domain-containing protein [Chloroflexi bacterium]|nr:FtsQ-type POTRA domain-containing protein [Chloroflexota bacterium]